MPRRPPPRPGSYERIDYTLRPAKAVERRMMCEAFQRLAAFAPLSAYRYVGLGSVYFHDFVLFHRSLGTEHMISIEKDEHNEERFRFNLPFGCIDLRMGLTTKVLGDIPWDRRLIVWLDYDGPLDRSVLTDVSTFCTQAVGGSVVIVTVNADPERRGDEQEGPGPRAPDDDEAAVPEPEAEGSQVEPFSRLARLRARLRDAEKVPGDVAERDLGGWGTARVCHRILRNQIREVISHRNGGLAPPRRLCYMQLFNFHYADGARMLTTGGLVYEEHQRETVQACRFASLPFVSDDDRPVLIRIPRLTHRERRHLDQWLPGKVPASKVPPCVDVDVVRQYAAIYKHFPNFAEVEL